MSDALKKYRDTLPKIFKPEANRVIAALLLALSQSDDEIQTQIQNAKDQNFVRTATGQDLDRVANSLGVSRPPTLGLTDEEFQELIPNLSLKPKQLKKSFYDTADVFWGPLFSRASLTTNNVAPWNVSSGDVISVKIDNGEQQDVKVQAGDIAIGGAATALEMQTILERIDGVTVEILEDSLTGDESLNMRTDTPGPVGTVEILASTMIGVSKLDFTVGTVDVLDLDQRVAVYNITPNELLIEIPAIVPSLRRTLKGSHHFHEDGTLEGPEPPNNGIWQGSFFFNPSGSSGNFTVTGQKATLQSAINKGDVLTSITVDDNSDFVNSSGELIFDFGLEGEEVPVAYRGIPNSNTILIDPSYVFTKDHSIGTVVNVISQKTPYEPLRDGTDLAIYFTSPSGARAIVQDILETLAAAGIVITFLVLAPTYKYIVDNPYIDDDDAPSI